MTDPFREEILLLRGQVDLLLERLGEIEGLGARPVHWSSLDPDTAAEEWAKLTGWVDWFTDRYQLTETLPACWYTHPPILEEIAALHTAWVGAYCDPAARSSDGVTWHDAAERVLGRIRTLDRAGCATAGTHRDDIPMPTAPPVLAARTETIRADIAARPRASHPDGEPSPPVSDED